MEILRIPAHCNQMLLIFLERDSGGLFFTAPSYPCCVGILMKEEGVASLRNSFSFFYTIYLPRITLKQMVQQPF